MSLPEITPEDAKLLAKKEGGKNIGKRMNFTTERRKDYIIYDTYLISEKAKPLKKRVTVTLTHYPGEKLPATLKIKGKEVVKKDTILVSEGTLTKQIIVKNR